LPPGIFSVCRKQTRPSSFLPYERRRLSARVLSGNLSQLVDSPHGKFFGGLCSRHQFHAEFGGLASYVGHVPCGAFAFIICGPPVDVFLTFGQ
jgi:hypothetical protein